MLCILAEADALGRIAGDAAQGAENVRLCTELAAECGCLDGAAEFASAYTRRAYCAGKNVWPGQALYNDSWGEVILMSALPGTGKDTWITQNCPELPMVSLDDIRAKLRIRHGEDQSTAIQTAFDRARELLRQKLPFVWNATDLSERQRSKQVKLFEQYRACVRIEKQYNLELMTNLGHALDVVKNGAAHLTAAGRTIAIHLSQKAD